MTRRRIKTTNGRINISAEVEDSDQVRLEKTTSGKYHWQLEIDPDPAHSADKGGKIRVGEDNVLLQFGDNYIKIDEDGIEYSERELPADHYHDGDTLQLDGINSDGGNFNFTTSGKIIFDQNIDLNGNDIINGNNIYSTGNLEFYTTGETTDNIRFYHTAGAMYIKAISSLLRLESDNSIELLSGSTILLRADSGENIYIDGGDQIIVRDRDSGYANRMVLDSSTGDLTLYGDFDISKTLTDVNCILKTTKTDGYSWFKLDAKDDSGFLLYEDGGLASYFKWDVGLSELQIQSDGDIFLDPTGNVVLDNNLDLNSNDIISDGSEIDINPSNGDNYSTFEADGTLEFNGDATVWNDINVGGFVLAQAPGQAPDQDEFKDSTGADTGISTYAIDVGEGVEGSFEIMHDYKEGSDITFHVHWQGIANPTGTDNVQWQLTYAILKDGIALSAATVITVEDGIDTQYGGYRTDFAAIDGTNLVIGDQFLFKLERIAASANEYGGDALLGTVGIHYEIDTVGSRTIDTK